MSREVPAAKRSLWDPAKRRACRAQHNATIVWSAVSNRTLWLAYVYVRAMIAMMIEMSHLDAIQVADRSFR